jgi:translation initiation factor 3 subunit B
MSEALDNDKLVDEAAELDGYFSDTPLQPQPDYPPLTQTFENAIIITNLPEVSSEKVDKLKKFVIKLVSRIGTLVPNDEFGEIYLPVGADGTTLGFCMVEYESSDVAKNAVDVLQNYTFDKNHALHTTLYARAQQLQTVSEEFQEPEPEPFQENANVCQWLEDPNQRDSFVVRYDKETVVSWWDAKNDPVVDYDGRREKESGVQWCDYYCHWSPKGSYLATLVPARGVILWSGPNYEKAGRFVAHGVKMVMFSSQENYLLTNNDDPKDPGAIIIYHIPTGKQLRKFPLFPEKVPMDRSPPPFLWSHGKWCSASISRLGEVFSVESLPGFARCFFLPDDNYLARMGNGLISIYETPGMGLLDKRSLAADGASEFKWSPKANILAYWVSYVVRELCDMLSLVS